MMHFRMHAAPALLAALLLAFTSPLASAQTVSDPTFVVDIDLFNGNGVTAFEFLPDGSILLAEKRGRLLRIAPDGRGGFGSPSTVLDELATTDSDGEGGFLGLELAPDYPTSRLAYLLQTTSTDQRVLELTLNATGTTVTRQRVLVSGLPARTAIHKAGHLAFRPGEPDHLYIALGDDGAPGDVQNLTLYTGKILRVDAATGEGVATNPFYRAGVDTLDSVRARIWAIGMRNPFRFTFHPVAGTPSDDPLWISENGDSTDRMARVLAGSDGAWSPVGDTGGFLSPPDPDFAVLETYTGPSPALVGITIAASGPFTDRGDDVLYVAGWNGNLWRYRLTGADLDGIATVTGDPATRIFARGVSAVDLEFAPDGGLYWVSSAGGDALGAGFMNRIRWVGGDPPVAGFTSTPDPISGRVPLAVSFTNTSTDSDGTLVEYRWDFGDGSTSDLESPSHTYTDSGDFTVSLTVVDDSGLAATTSASVVALRPFRVELAGEVQDGRDLGAGRFTGEAVLSLFRSDGVRPLAFPEGEGPDGNQVTIRGGVIDAVATVELTDAAIVGELSAPGLVPHRAARAVDPGMLDNRVTWAFVLAEVALAGQVRDTREAIANVDVGVRRGGAPYAIVGGRDYEDGGPPATGVAHRVTSDVLGFVHLPLRDAGTFTFDFAGDTGVDLYIPYGLDLDLPRGRTERDLLVGLLDGGLECDDLSEIAATPEVDYRTQIQPIWSRLCVGCHRPGSENGFGLNLTEDESHGDLLRIVSQEVPGLPLVTPFDPDARYLMEKLRCWDPQVGERMRPDSALAVEDQALVRDWIAQGAEDSDVPPEDMGPGLDPGPGDMGTDMTMPPQDMGPEDAGPPVDAGGDVDGGFTPTEPTTTLSASCAAGGGAGSMLWLLGVLALGLRRRRCARRRALRGRRRRLRRSRRPPGAPRPRAPAVPRLSGAPRRRLRR